MMTFDGSITCDARMRASHVVPSSDTIKWLLAFAFLAPLASAAVVTLGTRRVMFKAAGWFTLAVMAASCVASVAAALLWIGAENDLQWAISLLAMHCVVGRNYQFLHFFKKVSNALLRSKVCRFKPLPDGSIMIRLPSRFVAMAS